jgi:glycosyltransferase 2 family protein
MKTRTKALVSVGLLALLFAVIPWHEFAVVLCRMSVRVWLCLLTGFAFGHLLGVVKWRSLVSIGHVKLRFRDALMCYGAGLFTNLCLPTIVGGDLLRATMASHITKNTAAVAIGGVTDRLIDVLTLGLLLGLGLCLSTKQLPDLWGHVLIVALVVIAMVGVGGVPFFWRRPLFSWPAKWQRPIGHFIEALHQAWQAPWVLAFALALSITIQGGFVFLNVWLGRSIGIEVAISAWLIAWPAAKIAGLLPISLGGLAVREVSLAALLLPFGIPAATGVAASLIWQSILIGGGLLGGGLWLLLRSPQANSLTPPTKSNIDTQHV